MDNGFNYELIMMDGSELTINNVNHFNGDGLDLVFHTIQGDIHPVKISAIKAMQSKQATRIHRDTKQCFVWMDSAMF
jgi:hypothetical protein